MPMNAVADLLGTLGQLLRPVFSQFDDIQADDPADPVQLRVFRDGNQCDRIDRATGPHARSGNPFSHRSEVVLNRGRKIDHSPNAEQIISIKNGPLKPEASSLLPHSSIGHNVPADIPPSTYKTCPVINADAFDAR